MNHTPCTMQDFEHQNILVAITGGIAAYKAVYLVRELKKRGANVRVLMTAAATQFVTPMSLQALSGAPVALDLWQTEAANGMDHIALVRWAHVMIVLPASANRLAQFAHGIADDLLGTLYLAANIPILICPAMNQQMWQHPAVQANIATLKQRPQHLILPPESGEAACGEVGVGRLCDTEQQIQLLHLYALQGVLINQTVIITMGPTYERLDPVRYLTNDSSGKMGYALAMAAWTAGANVTVITGPTAMPALPEAIQVIPVESAKQMHQAVQAHLTPNCIFIGAAAVGDFHATTVSAEKMKKQSTLTLTLETNPDILLAVSRRQIAQLIVGFAAETTDLIAHATKKRQAKGVDLMVANEVGPHKGFHQDGMTVTFLSDAGEHTLPYLHKTRIAKEIIQWLANVIASPE